VKMSKSEVLGWAAVAGVVGLIAYAGYRGVKSIFGSETVKTAESIAGLVLNTPSQHDADTKVANEAIFATTAAETAYQNDAEMTAALASFDKEFKESEAARMAMKPTQDWLFFEKDRGYNAYVTQYQEMLSAAQAVNKISESKYGFDLIRMAQN